jgi:cell fate regulator YaaT (PSP1 superfamily)
MEPAVARKVNPQIPVGQPIDATIGRTPSCNFCFRLKRESEREGKAAVLCRGKIAELKLPMALVNVVASEDGHKLTFNYTTEGRIDGRELIKQLSAQLSAKIDLRQIGVREKAGILGGCGSCGRPLCCSTWLRSFKPITLQMAKKQGLNVNPYKLSGLCGRLKCCLRYEL